MVEPKGGLTLPGLLYPAGGRFAIGTRTCLLPYGMDPHDTPIVLIFVLLNSFASSKYDLHYQVAAVLHAAVRSARLLVFLAMFFSVTPSAAAGLELVRRYKQTLWTITTGPQRPIRMAYKSVVLT